MPKYFFAERVAERYDETSADMFEPVVVSPVVEFLAGLARDGTALELGIGTGRIALPLSQQDVRLRKSEPCGRWTRCLLYPWSERRHSSQPLQ